MNGGPNPPFRALESFVQTPEALHRNPPVCLRVFSVLFPQFFNFLGPFHLVQICLVIWEMPNRLMEHWENPVALINLRLILLLIEHPSAAICYELSTYSWSLSSVWVEALLIWICMYITLALKLKNPLLALYQEFGSFGKGRGNTFSFFQVCRCDFH